MLWRETPTASASCCCVQPRSLRSSLTRFRTLGDVKLAFHHHYRAEIQGCQVYLSWHFLTPPAFARLSGGGYDIRVLSPYGAAISHPAMLTRTAWLNSISRLIVLACLATIAVPSQSDAQGLRQKISDL